MPEIVGEDEIAGERVGERLVKVEDLEELVALDRVEIAVGQGAHVSRALAYRAVLPEAVAEYVAFAQDRDDLVVLDDLEAARHDEAERVYRLAGVVE